MNELLTTLATMGTALALTACASTGVTKHTALPLDHGPRAQATPWQNQQRLLHAEQQAKVDAAKSSPNANR